MWGWERSIEVLKLDLPERPLNCIGKVAVIQFPIDLIRSLPLLYRRFNCLGVKMLRSNLVALSACCIAVFVLAGAYAAVNSEWFSAVALLTLSLACLPMLHRGDLVVFRSSLASHTHQTEQKPNIFPYIRIYETAGALWAENCTNLDLSFMMLSEDGWELVAWLKAQSTTRIGEVRA